MRIPPIFSTINQLNELLAKRDKLKLLWLALFAVFSSVLEILTASIIVVFASTITHPAVGMKYLAHLGIKKNLPAGKVILYFAVIFALVFVFKNIVGIIQIVLQSKIIQRMNYKFKHKVLSHYANMDYGFFLTRNSTFGISVITSDVEQMFSVGVLAIITVLSEGVVFLCLVIMIVVMNPNLAGVLFGLIAVIGFCLYKFLLPIFYKWGVILQNVTIAASKQLIQFFHGYKEIVLFGKSNRFAESYASYAKEESVIQAANKAANNSPRLVIEIIFVLLFVSIISYTSYSSTQPGQMMGVLAGYLYLGFRLMPGLNRIVTQINNYKLVIPRIDRVYKELNSDVKIMDLQHIANFTFNNKISIKDLSYRYLNTDNFVLKNISLEIQKGDCIGIVGETGSGKSTLVDIILGLLRPTKGVISIDNKFPPACNEWHQIIGYVPQAIYLIDETIEANVAFGEDNIDEARVDKAIKLAQIDKLISKLPDGIKTVVGERGVRLSGGERQRIAIARALYRDPQVLIFDEATSSLDIETEKTLMETINLLSENYTVIMVAHRLSTLSRCNKIISVSNGVIEQRSCLFEEEITV